MARRETPGGAASFGEYPARSTSSIAAIVPSRLNSAVACAALPEYGSQTTDGLVLGDSAALGVLRIDPGSMRDTAALPRRKFYGDIEPAHNADRPAVRGPAHELHRAGGGRHRGSWGSMPRTCVKTTQDPSISSAVQDIMIRGADELTPDNRSRPGAGPAHPYSRRCAPAPACWRPWSSSN